MLPCDTECNGAASRAQLCLNFLEVTSPCCQLTYSSVMAERVKKAVAGHLKRPSPAGVGRPPEARDWEP